MDLLLISGFFLTRRYDFLPDKGSGKPHSSQQIVKAIEYFRAEVDRIDQAVTEIKRYSGLGDQPVHTEAWPWKTADAEWFEAHPHRSHYIRDRWADEGQPDGLFNKVVVRQIRQGLRCRKSLLMEFPEGFVDLRYLMAVAELMERDEEAVAHALFDLAVGGPWPDNIREVLEMIDRYRTSGVAS
jgi:hypothetical protein